MRNQDSPAPCLADGTVERGEIPLVEILTTEIPDSRRLVIRLPEDVPTGTARIAFQLTPGRT